MSSRGNAPSPAGLDREAQSPAGLDVDREAKSPAGLDVRGEGLGGRGLKRKSKCVSCERQRVKRHAEAWGRKLQEEREEEEEAQL